ncbi:MAG: hypothetical protein ABL894_07015 [Hyphomicrobium sp.]
MRNVVLAPALLAAAFFATPAGAEPMGVAQCDSFFAKYEQCIGKVPEGQKENARVAINMLRSMMQMAHNMNRGDASLTGMLCENLQQETQKDADLQGYGCTW